MNRFAPPAAVILLAVAAARAGAQDSAGAAGPAPSFSVNASLFGGWDSNPWLQPGGQGSTTGQARGSLAKTWTRPRFRFSANAQGQASFYQLDTAPSRYDYGAGVSASGALDSQTDASLSGGASIQHNDQLFDTLAPGLLLPVTRTATAFATAGISRRLGTRTRFAAGGNAYKMLFDSQSLVDSSGLGATASLARTVSARSELSVNYGYQVNDYGGGAGRSQSHLVYAGYGLTLGPRSRLSFALGASNNFGSTTPGNTWALYADGSYSYSWQKSSLAVSYTTGVRPGPGIGQDRILSSAAARFSTTPNSWFSAALATAYSRNGQIVGGTQTYSANEASLSLHARLTRDLGFGLQQSYQRRSGFSTVPAVADYRIGVGLDYTRSFR